MTSNLPEIGDEALALNEVRNRADHLLHEAREISQRIQSRVHALLSPSLVSTDSQVEKA